MTKIRLHYFNTRGRAEGIRKLLHYKNVPYEELLIERDEWPKKKQGYKYGQVPALEVDGKFLYQSSAIIRYLARKYKMEGKDEWETAKLDEINELWNEFHEAITEYIYVLLGFIPGDKEKLRKEKFVPAWQKYAPHFEVALKEAGSGFYANSGLTYLDFAISQGAEQMILTEPELVKDYPLFVANSKRVNALPELQEYMKIRPAH